MTTSKEEEEFGRNPRLWSVSAIKWVFENPDYRFELVSGIAIKDPAWEGDSTKVIENIEVPDFEAAVAAGHALLDKYAREAGDLGLEISLMPPKLPYPGQEAFGAPTTSSPQKRASRRGRSASVVATSKRGSRAWCAMQPPSTTRPPTCGIAASP
jgi:hypothetical protein